MAKYGWCSSLQIREPCEVLPWNYEGTSYWHWSHERLPTVASALLVARIMSRGRGGFRGPAGTHRIAGVDIPADADIQLDQKPPPTPDYPVSSLLKNHTLSPTPICLANRWLDVTSSAEIFSGTRCRSYQTSRQEREASIREIQTYQASYPRRTHALHSWPSTSCNKTRFESKISGGAFRSIRGHGNLEPEICAKEAANAKVEWTPIW